MMMLTHAAFSGAVGAVIPNPYLAFSLGLIAHLILDKIPHNWPEDSSGKLVQKIFNVTSTLVLLIFLFFLPARNHLGIFWGAMGGIVIDVWLVGIMAEKGKAAAWHTKRQPHHTHYAWLLTDGLLFMASMLALWWLK